MSCIRCCREPRKVRAEDPPLDTAAWQLSVTLRSAVAAKAGCEQVQESKREEKAESSFSHFSVQKRSKETGIGWRDDVKSREGFTSAWFCVMGEMIACWYADGKMKQKAGGWVMIAQDELGGSLGLTALRTRTGRGSRHQRGTGFGHLVHSTEREGGYDADASGRVDVRLSLSAPHCPSFLGELGNKSLSGE